MNDWPLIEHPLPSIACLETVDRLLHVLITPRGKSLPTILKGSRRGPIFIQSLGSMG